jgi:hypothetical protein
VDGSWLAHVQRDRAEYLYEVDLGLNQKRAIGRWSVETFKSSTGCLIGDTRGEVVHFRTCTTDGSAGTRDMAALCPEYHADRNRFIPKGDKLAWEVWDERSRSFRLFVLLERAKQKRAILWSEEECGKR